MMRREFITLIVARRWLAVSSAGTATSKATYCFLSGRSPDDF